MGSKKTTQTSTNTIPARSAQEQQLIQMLTQMGMDTSGQMGDLSQLASGQGLVPTAADQSLVEQSIGASSDIARRQLEDFVSQQQLGLDEAMSARGIGGSSIESMNRAIIGRDAQRQMANMLSQQQQQGAQALMQLPFQRAGVQLNANQALFQRLAGAVNPALSTALQERLAQGTSTQTQEESGFSSGDMVALGGQIGALAAAPFTGGMSLAAMPAMSQLGSEQATQMGQGGLNFTGGASTPYYRSGR